MNEDAPNPSERVHFSQGGLASGAGLPPMAATVAALLIPQLLLFALPIVVLVGDFLPWLPRGLQWAAASFLLIALACVSFPKLLHAYRRGTDIRGLPLDMDPDARVNVVCWNDQRRELEPLEDIAFEPEQFRAFLPDRLPERGPLSWLRTNPQTFNVAYGALVLSIVLLPQLLAPQVAGAGVITMLVVALTVSLFLFRRPTYLRVMPGRAQILRYPLWGSGGPDIETLDLRAQPVRLDVRTGRLYLGPWSKQDLPRVDAGWNLRSPKAPAVRTWAVRDRAAAERALYLACISTAEPSPMDDLPEGASPVTPR